MANELIEPKDCERCGESIPIPEKSISQREWGKKRFCSRACARRSHLPAHIVIEEEKECISCGAIFRRNGGSLEQWGVRKYCSRGCFTKANRGENHWATRDESKTCAACRVEFHYRDTASKGKMWEKQKYCSVRCSAIGNSGENHHAWKGGRYSHGAGYVVINDGSGPKLEHRVIWEEHNGPIPEDMVIHHINGDKTDNRIENLQILSRSQHAKEHGEDMLRALYEKLDRRFGPSRQP